MKKAVFFGSRSMVNWVYSRETKEDLFRTFDFEYGERILTKDELKVDPHMMQDVSYIFTTWNMPAFTEEEIGQFFPKVEALFYAAGSVQDFAREFLAQGIRVFSAWAANGVPVAEYTLAQIILANKGYSRRLHLPGSGNEWKNRYDMKGLPGNYEATLGIIGAGMIGKLVIQRVQSLLERMRILVFDPFLPEEKAKEMGVTLCDLPTLFSESDVISNHLADNKQTEGMLNGALFDRMKTHATFINTGRGAQIVEADLIAALIAVPTRYAVLDVTFPEPPESDSLLYTLPNVFLSPHIAGSLGHEVHRMAEYMLEESRRYDEGRPVRYEVTMEMLKTMA